MRKFLTHEVRWTEAVTNTLALGFSLMTMAVITYAAIFNPSVLTTVGSATSGITGVILGYYFNRERLVSAQRRAELEAQERIRAAADVSLSEERLAALSEDFTNLVLKYEEDLARLRQSED